MGKRNVYFLNYNFLTLVINIIKTITVLFSPWNLRPCMQNWESVKQFPWTFFFWKEFSHNWFGEKILYTLPASLMKILRRSRWELYLMFLTLDLRQFCSLCVVPSGYLEIQRARWIPSRECAKKIDRVYRVLHDITMDKIRVHTCCPSCLKDIFCKLHKFLSTFAGRLQLLLNCDGILFSSSKIWNRQCFCCLEKMLVKMFPHQKRLMRT